MAISTPWIRILIVLRREHGAGSDAGCPWQAWARAAADATADPPVPPRRVDMCAPQVPPQSAQSCYVCECGCNCQSLVVCSKYSSRPAARPPSLTFVPLDP